MQEELNGEHAWNLYRYFLSYYYSKTEAFTLNDNVQIVINIVLCFTRYLIIYVDNMYNILNTYYYLAFNM